MNFNLKYFSRYFLALLFCASSLAFAQNVPSSIRTPNTNCWDCVPNSGWVKPLGTPDVSSATIAAATSSQGTGQSWIGGPLPLPPNNHERWITMRDLGGAGAEEIIETTMTNLVVGREYELLIYTSTFRTSGNYSPVFNDRFQYLLEGQTARVTIPTITQNSWATSRLRFVATNASRTIRFFPGENGGGTGAFESVNLSLSLNAINTVPIAVADNTQTLQGVPVSFNVAANDSDPDGLVNPNSIDLDPSTPGIDTSVTTSQGLWSVAGGVVTFTPVPTFTGVATIPYTIKDNYSLDGISNPSTSNSANISITVIANNVDTDGDGISDLLDLDDDNDGILDSAEGLCATTSLVTRDGFDTTLTNNPVTINGNNIQTTNPFNGWSAANPTTGALLPATAFNIIRVDGTGYALGPDFAQSGSQYVDINGANAYVYQDFTFTTPTVVSASAWFANRATGVAGYVPYTTRIEIINTATNTAVAQGNQLSFTLAVGDEGWYRSAVSNIALPVGTYRIRMFVSDFGHLDSISYCFSTDTDGDGTPNYLDVDSDNDGCPDALEGSENVRITQVYPLNFTTVPLRGQIRVTHDGVTPGTPAQIVSTGAAANGVPQLVNNAVNNPNTSPANTAGISDNTDGTADVGQGIGSSQNTGVQDPDCLRCFKPANTAAGIDVTHGFTSLNRAGANNGNWPMKIKSAYTVLDAKTLGFVINRLTSAQIGQLVPVVGMAAYDTDLNCLRIYDGAGWSCYTKQTCDQ